MDNLNNETIKLLDVSVYQSLISQHTSEPNFVLSRARPQVYKKKKEHVLQVLLLLVSAVRQRRGSPLLVLLDGMMVVHSIFP